MTSIHFASEVRPAWEWFVVEHTVEINKIGGKFYGQTVQKTAYNYTKDKGNRKTANRPLKMVFQTFNMGVGP